MSDPICPFSATLAKADFGCRRAEQVIRRGGAEFACREPAAYERCRRLFEKFKTAALPAFGVADDLTQMPQSVQVKVQFGGLLGLQRSIAPAAQPRVTVGDIDALLEEVLARHGTVDAIPCDRLVDDITGYKLPRRSSRR